MLVMNLETDNKHFNENHAYFYTVLFSTSEIWVVKIYNIIKYYT